MIIWPVSAFLAELEGRISSASLPRPKSELLLFRPGSWARWRARSTRLVGVDASSRIGALGAAQGVAGAGVAQAHGDDDAARAGALDALAAVGVHGETRRATFSLRRVRAFWTSSLGLSTPE